MVGHRFTVTHGKTNIENFCSFNRRTKLIKSRQEYDKYISILSFIGILFSLIIAHWEVSHGLENYRSHEQHESQYSKFNIQTTATTEGYTEIESTASTTRSSSSSMRADSERTRLHVNTRNNDNHKELQSEHCLDVECSRNNSNEDSDIQFCIQACKESRKKCLYNYSPANAVKLFNLLCSFTVLIQFWYTYLFYSTESTIYKYDNSIAPDLRYAKSHIYIFLAGECFLYVIHPVTYLHGWNFYSKPGIYFTPILRVPVLLRTLILKSSLYDNLTTEVIATLNNINFGSLTWENVRMISRHYFYKFSLEVVLIQVTIVWFGAAWILHLAEARHALLNCDMQETSYDYYDMVWLVPITLTTIGYGDIVPKSFIGRFTMLCVGFYGLVATAHLVSIVTGGLNMTRRERQILNLLESSELRKDVRNKAAILMQRIWRAHKHRRGSIYLPINPEEMQNLVQRSSLAEDRENRKEPKRTSISSLVKEKLATVQNLGPGAFSGPGSSGHGLRPFFKRSYSGSTSKTMSYSNSCSFKNIPYRPDHQNVRMLNFNHRLKTHIPLIRNISVLEAITQFRKARIKKRYLASDTIDMIGIGIKQTSMDCKLDSINDRIDDTVDGNSRVEDRLDRLEFTSTIGEFWFFIPIGRYYPYIAI